jgi:hypothetical protein
VSIDWWARVRRIISCTCPMQRRDSDFVFRRPTRIWKQHITAPDSIILLWRRTTSKTTWSLRIRYPTTLRSIEAVPTLK